MYTDCSSIRSLPENPYWVFISSLYAWIAANIAERFSKISSDWSEYQLRKPRWWHIPVYSHLFLAAFVVGTSWLGWTHAFVKKDVTVFEDAIVSSSLLLIIDFWIVGTYFSFVAVVNKARLSDGELSHSTQPGAVAGVYSSGLFRLGFPHVLCTSTVDRMWGWKPLLGALMDRSSGFFTSSNCFFCATAGVYGDNGSRPTAVGSPN